MLDSSFVTDFLSNLLATLIGILIGLPIAFWLDRRAKASSEKAKAMETRKRHHKILSILKAELDEDVEAIAHRHMDMKNYFTPVRVEAWRAFSDGGELQWIDDPEVVNSLAVAYAHISHYSFALERYYDAYFNLERKYTYGSSEPLFDIVLKLSKPAVAAAEAARSILTDRLMQSGIALDGQDDCGTTSTTSEST